MKSSKFILGAAALVATSLSSLALRAGSGSGGDTELFTDITRPCHLVACFTLPVGIPNPNRCPVGVPYYTQQGIGNACAGKWEGPTTTSD